MELDQIKELMRGGDVAAAAEALKELISAEPGNQEAKLLYGTCCHICGDDATLVQIDEEVAKDPDFNHKRIYRKYHAMRVAACGLAAFAVAATVAPPAVSAESPESGLYGGYTLYGAPVPLYGVYVKYGAFICETEKVKISFHSGGGSGTMSSVQRSVNACEAAVYYTLPQCAFKRSGYVFTGWSVEYACGRGDSLQPGDAIEIYSGCGDFDVTAQWRKTGTGGGDVYKKMKAQSLGGLLYDSEGEIAGSVLLKVGKPNAKTGKTKISGTVTMLNGTKKSITPKTASMSSDGAVATSVSVKNLGTANIEVEDGAFYGDLNGYAIESADVGGAWGGSSANVAVEFDDLSMFSGEVQEDLLPYEVSASVSRGKWSFPRAASVKLAKSKGSTEKKLVVNTKTGSNLSGLKLTYTPSKGTFKGTFKIYEIRTAGGKKTLKKHSVKVSGIVVNGAGYGVATLKKPGASWAVRVE